MVNGILKKHGKKNKRANRSKLVWEQKNILD
jgi:hypothetical protein